MNHEQQRVLPARLDAAGGGRVAVSGVNGC